MRIIVVDKNAVLLNHMWLPTWLGENHQFKKNLEEKLRKDVEGKELTDEVLNEIHDKIIDFIVEQYPIPGLFDYLDGLKYVEL